jgi:isoleucyl-tRNA synthetase
MFDPVPPSLDVPALEHTWLDRWKSEGLLAAYLRRNEHSPTKFSFIDGPITANNPMGIHHAWGRTYKDLVQRYRTMLGHRQRYQNGFDCQGLWVEVEVEKELGYNSKRDIEEHGIDKFVQRCKERVLRFARVQTDQSIRLGYFMDWDNSYYTMSDENNYSIWGVLKRCHERGWIYQGRDVMPWCIRCATALSDMEIATEGYQEVTHQSVYVRLPIVDRPGEYLLVWTTTPWTLTSNVAVAVNPELTYLKVRQGDDVYYLSKGALKTALEGRFVVLEELRGDALVGWRYTGPFDDLPAAKVIHHRVIVWDEVGDAEGTGLVHIAPGCGREDLVLGKRDSLPVLSPLDEFGIFIDGFGWLTGMHVAAVAEPIFENLREKGYLSRVEPYTHRYPVCWRCHSELVFRLVDEWFIRLDELRPKIMDVARQINWIPDFGLERELDWLRNMDDWMISKKRYWGLALPIFPCPSCGHVDVIGSKEELYARAVTGLEYLPSPHRPWIDAVRIRCTKCDSLVARILDVGNPWLDAGIVPYSTLHYHENRSYWEEWFPADFITEAFPGQYRNWFYSMLTMSTILENRPPYLTVLGHANVGDEHGREMHKSLGNSIEFDQAADLMGADVIRWTFMGHPPATPMRFGYRLCEETRRRLLTLWNVYKFFVDYARIDAFDPTAPALPVTERTAIDHWILARLHALIASVRDHLDRYDIAPTVKSIEAFVDELSTWYIRRGRRRYWKPGADADKSAAYHTLHEVLVTLSKLIAPYMPFLAEEMFHNLTSTDSPATRNTMQSVHLMDYPVAQPELIDDALISAVASVQKVVELGRLARAKAQIKVRQSLPRVLVALPSSVDRVRFADMEAHVREELNVKSVEVVEETGAIHDASIKPRMAVLGPRYGKRLQALLVALREQPHVLHADGGATVGDFTLDPDEIEVVARPRPGLAVTQGDGYVVALDTTVSPDLQMEGRARDLVRRIQVMRKEAGFEIIDRIVVTFDAGSELAAALEQYDEYVRTETLALEVREGLDLGMQTWSGEIAGEPVRLGVAKAAVVS